MNLTKFMRLGSDDLEMELVEFQSSIVWKNTFEKILKVVQILMISLLKIENIILNLWDSFFLLTNFRCF